MEKNVEKSLGEAKYVAARHARLRGERCRSLLLWYRDRVETLSLTGKRWQVRDCRSEASGMAVVDLLERQRRIERIGAGELPDAFGENIARYRDFPTAAERVLQAIRAGERIGVFGDYDCDGITGSALLIRFLRRRGIHPVIRLPHRLREGYGLRTSMMEEFIQNGVRLLLTVDTGVTALDAIARGCDAGVDTIVLDHHQLPEQLPRAAAILHPALAEGDAIAPCGAGVAWGFVRALEEHLGHAEWDDWETDIALAAIGTVADVVELRGHNRALVHRGLIALQRLTDGPLKLLCLHAGLTPPFTSRDIGFRIAPRINAAGRMADPHTALSALLGDEAALLSLHELNRQRQDVVADLLEKTLPLAERQTSSLLCFSSPDYSPGICGLLAGKLTERFGKPSLIAFSGNHLCTASLRSISEYDVTAGLRGCADLLQSYGGHAMAAGCAFVPDNLPSLHERLNADIIAAIGKATLHPTLTADVALSAAHITLDLCHALSSLEPFGQGNPEPRFIIRDVTLRNARCVGADKTHLQALVAGKKLIGFRLGHLHEYCERPVDLLCTVGIDAWQGKARPQLFLDDMRISTPAPISLPS